MTFGRSEAEWLDATPAQVDTLLRVHKRIHTPGKSADRETGTVADLLAFQSMRRV